MLRLWLLSTVLLVACTALAAADLALLDMTRPTSSHSEDTDTFCFVYNPAFANLALRSETPTMAVVQATPADACTPLLGNATLLYAGRAVLVDRGNCTFGDKAKQIQEAGGLLVVVINTDDSAFVPGGNASVYAEVHIPVGMLASSDGRTLVAAVQAGSANLRVQVRTPSMPTIDPSFFVMCLIAMVTTVAATYWTNHEEREQLRLQRKRRIESAGDESDPLNSSDGARPASSQQRAQASLVRAAEHTSEASHLSLSLRNVLIFVAFAITVILLMYFLFDYLVYVVIALFCMGATNALFTVFRPLVRKLPVGLATLQVPCCGSVEIRELALVAMAMSLTITWAVIRNESSAWILQDFLGVIFVAVIIKSIRIGSVKVASLLLILFFLYDIFFVFITPLFTNDGESVMVQVATGSGSTNEQLPMVLKLPRLVDPYSGSCGVAYTVLGFGDLVMPSFLLAFCLMFDYRRHLVDTVVKGSLRGRLTLAMFETGKRRSARGSQDDAAGSADSLPHEHVGVNEAEPAVDVEAIISCAVLLRASHPNVTRGARPVYFFSCVFAYFVGLMATYATLVGSGKAQPALLYLVPSTLGCTLLVAWWRHELPLVWRGVHSLTDEVWEEYDRLRADAADENRTFSSRGGNTNIEDGATSSSSSSSSSRVSVSNRGRPRKESLDSDDADTERLL